MTNPILTPEQLAEIEAREKKATAGPWRHVIHGCDDLIEFQPGNYAEVNVAADARFCAHARIDIPGLIASHRALEAKLKSAEEALDEAANDLARIETADWQAEQMRLGAKSGRYRAYQALARIRGSGGSEPPSQLTT